MYDFKKAIKEGKIEWGNLQANIVFIEKSGVLDKNKNILEIGCGTGSLTHYFFERGYNIIGIDLAQDLIHKGKELYGNELPININKNGEKLEYQDNSFDAVLSFDVFEHIPESDIHLQEVKRVLKRRGFYLCCTPNKWTNIPFEIITQKSLTKYRIECCSLHNYWQVKKRFKKNGFEVEFVNISVATSFFKAKIRKVFGNIGLFLLKIFNPDKFPMFLRTNFYIIAKKQNNV